eukprot:TRINITY_DN1789_c0_g2_i2.p1 TRINITY_DN1789_c0_g2~~TRINITY_DN1789_c0_g2_i2.p1  ORF type:complete len:333 (+),score=41.60 TRINITY_DN1789_c0_g2_i2:42-1040(+)
MMKMVRIGTHNGTFHADEVLACALLKILPKYKDSEIVRTRDPKVLETCDIVVDVGGEFVPEKQRFDHHQKSFTHTMNSLDPKYKYEIKLSSAGLVYFHFGKEILSTLEEKDTQDPLVETLFTKLYEKFIQEVDGIDNGIETHDSEGRYTINTNFSSRIGNFNPAWNEESDDNDQMKRFEKAMVQADSEFRDKVHFYARSWWPARKIVADAIEQRFDVHPSGQVLEFKQGGVPWKEHLLQLEVEQGLEGQLYYVIYTDQSGKWRVQCVPVSSTAFQNRLSLPENWRGVRDAELEKLSGIPGCIFVHASGFIGGNETREGVMQMVDVALKQQSK